MDEMFSIFVLTDPVAKARPRFTRSGVTYTPAKTEGYETLIRSKWIHGIQEGPLSVKMLFFVRMPASWSSKKKAGMYLMPCSSRPDLDNYVKAVLDALNGKAYSDDKAVTALYAGKIWSYDPGIYISIQNSTTEYRDRAQEILNGIKDDE